MGSVRAPGHQPRSGRGIVRWVMTGAAILILIGLGFFLGVGLGIFAVGPELIVDHGRGHTQEIPWSVDAPTSIEGLTQPNSIAEEISGGAAPAAEAEPAAVPAEKVQVRVRGGKGFSVQVGAFGDPGKAETLVRKLRAEDLPVYRIPSADSGDDRWRVRVGPVSSRVEADQLAVRLKSEFDLPTWVLTEGGLNDGSRPGHR